MPMEMKNAAKMTPNEIIDEVRRLRDGIEQASSRLHELSRILYAQARRDPDSEASQALILYANAWTRFSGAIGQGVQRTAHVDRVLRASQRRAQDIQEQKELEEARREQRERKAHQRVVAPSLIPSKGVEDLVELYGPDVVTNHA